MALKRPAASSTTPTTTERHADLVALGKDSYVSQSGMSKLLAVIEKHGVPEAYSRASQYRARKSVCATETPYGRLVEPKTVTLRIKQDDDTFKNEELTIGVQNPLAWVWYNCKHSKHYGALIERAFERHSCSPEKPWRIMLYLDGVDPSDGLSKSHTRSFYIFYWIFLEFDSDALCHEELWGVPCILRTDKIKNLEHGLPELATLILDQFFGHEHNIMTTGVNVQVNGRRYKIFARWGGTIADEPAMKELTSCKGHAGIKCCFYCQNCTLARQPGGHGDDALPFHLFSDFCVTIAEFNIKKFLAHTDESIRNHVQRLHGLKGTMTDAMYSEREIVYGFNYNQRSVILNERYAYNVISGSMIDWAHTWVSDGLADTEWGTCMKKVNAAHPQLTTYTEFGKYALSFTTPIGRPLPKHLFDPLRCKNYIKKGSFAAIASEFLTLAPIIKRYLSRVVVHRGQCMDHVLSMRAVLDVLELLQASKNPGIVDPLALFEAIQKHLILYSRAYGAESVRPKHHYSLHVPKLLADFNFLFNTMTHERKHRTAKKYTVNRKITKSFELGTLEDVTCHGLWELSLDFSQADSVSEPKGSILPALRECFPGIDDAAMTLHRGITIHGGKANPGDVVSYSFEGRMCVGKLWVVVGVLRKSETLLMAVVSVWQECNPRDVGEDPEDTSCRTYQVHSRKVKISCDELNTVFTYRMSDDGCLCTLLVPWECR